MRCVPHFLPGKRIQISVWEYLILFILIPSSLPSVKWTMAADSICKFSVIYSIDSMLVIYLRPVFIRGAQIFSLDWLWRATDDNPLPLFLLFLCFSFVIFFLSTTLRWMFLSYTSSLCSFFYIVVYSLHPTGESTCNTLS